MKKKDLLIMQQIISVKHEFEQAAVRPVVLEERRLRLDLKRLAELKQRGEKSDQYLQRRRSFGGDVAWEVWLERKWRMLNSELACVLSRKGQMTSRLKQSFGRKQALDVVRVESSFRKMQNSRKYEDQRVLANSIFRNF